MTTLFLNMKSQHSIRFPRPTQRHKLVNLTERFIAQESTLPAKAQTPYTTRLTELLQQASPTHNGQLHGELQRTAASEALKRLDQTATQLIRRIWRTMNATFMDTPERAEEWGFNIKQATGNILIPRKRAERLTMLDSYIAREQSRPAKERFATPDLTEVIAVRDQLRANLTARNNGKARRETSVAASRAIAGELLQNLQAAAAYLISTRYNFTLTPELQQWGFTVVAARNGNGHGNGHANGHDSDPSNGVE